VLATIASARSVDRISTGTQKHITDRSIVSRQEWAAARAEPLAPEKEHTRLGDELARQRRELPWLRVDKDYRFDTDEGEEALDELFDGRGQLLAYHFMPGPRYQAGCRSAPRWRTPSTTCLRTCTLLESSGRRRHPRAACPSRSVRACDPDP
jgi:Bacterial protein of unknown function (DUF899)